MTVPNFLDKLTGKKTDQTKSFLALVLSDHRVQAAVWQVVATKTEIISLGTPVEWDGDVATTSELVSAVDATISSATEGLETEPEEIVLGLANNWVEPTGIKQSKKDLIKSICTELSLKPIGYVVLSDTIVKYLKMQEGAPPTSILIQLDHHNLTLSLVELGTIKHTVTVGSSDNISSDVAEGLTRFPPDSPLPSRFILVSAMENTSDLVQSLTAFDWTKAFKFLHTPKIEALPKDVEVHATAVAGGSEVAASLGFSLEPEPEVEPELPQAKELTAEELGFAPVTKLEEEPLSAQPQDVQEEQLEETTIAPNPVYKPSFQLPKITLPKIRFRLPKINFGSKSIYIILGSILVIVSLIIYAIYTVPHATVTLTLKAKPITQNLDLILGTDQSGLDPNLNFVPATYSQTKNSGQDSVPATGQKTVGDPSAGEVTIYNRTSLQKTFASGTTISYNNLKFTLDDDVTIASKSAGSDYVDVPGKANVAVTATSFGSEGNLSSNTEFTVANFSKDSFVAKNDSAFSGGSSQEITVVSEDDLSALLSKLKDSLASQVADQAQTNNGGEQSYVLTDDIEVESQKFSAKKGEEASSVSLDLTIAVGLLTYKIQDVQNLVSQTLNQATPPGYQKSTIAPDIILGDTSLDDNHNLTSSASVTFYVTPDINLDNLKTSLKGKTTNQARTFLSTIPAVSQVQFVITPNLPPRLSRLPYNLSHLTLEFNSDK